MLWKIQQDDLHAAAVTTTATTTPTAATNSAGKFKLQSIQKTAPIFSLPTFTVTATTIAAHNCWFYERKQLKNSSTIKLLILEFY